jgi:hypothetical protein
MLQLIKIATLSAALSVGIVAAYGGARHDPSSGTTASYDRLPESSARDEAGVLRMLAPSNPRA